ncbi:MAG: glycosyltransferase family 39 protein, partial [Dehalococcoidia bacterium]|nr:glycosyltransferase family 39 protein [Dehalococcoidia bacterium]
YRDLWDNKGPLLFLWYAASFASLGESVVAPRLFAALAAGLSVPFVWATARTLIDRRLAALAAALFARSFLNIYFQVTANAEVFMLLPLTAGLWAFALGARSQSPWPFLAAGVLTSLAVFTRQSALWTLIGYGVWLAVPFLRHREERQQLLRAGIALAAGAALAAVPFVVYFAAHGALYDLWYAMFAFNWAWAGEFPLYMKLVPPLLGNPVPLVGGLVFWTLAAIGVWRLVLRGDRSAWLILSFLIFSEAAVQTLGKVSPHYSVQLMPGAAIAGAVGFAYAWERWREGWRLPATAVVVAASVTAGAAVFAYAQPTPADRFEVQYTYRDYAKDAIVAPEIASAVEEMTRPGDYIYEWGKESEIYFLAGRQPASRWLHNRVYSVDRSIIDEVIGDLEEKRPALILLTLEEDDLASGGYRPPAELAAYLDDHYRFADRVEYADLFQREER